MKAMTWLLILSILLVSCSDEASIITYEYQCYDGSFVGSKEDCPTVIDEEEIPVEDEEKIEEVEEEVQVVYPEEEVDMIEDLEIYVYLVGQHALIYYLYPESYDYGPEIKVRINLESDYPAQIKILNSKRDYDLFMSARPISPKRTWQSVRELDVVESVSKGNVLLIYNGNRGDDITVTGWVEYLD